MVQAAYLPELPLNAKLSIIIEGLHWCWPHARSEDLVEIQLLLFCDTVTPRDFTDTIKWVPAKS